jgi:hypothetical protein
LRPLPALISRALVLSAFLLPAFPAAALCLSGNTDREIVGQLPDLFLRSGIPEVRSIHHRHAIYDAPPITTNPWPFYDCQSNAMSTTTGVSVESTYGYEYGVGPIHPPGELASIAQSDGTSGSSMGPYFGPHASPVELKLHFDGTAPAGTRGNIVVTQQRTDGGAIVPDRGIGEMNVYVIDSDAPVPKTALRVVGDAASIINDHLILDHPLLNGSPQNRILISHSVVPGDPASAMAWPHATSVGYDVTLARWFIRNDDRAAMPAGIAFNVRIDPSARVTVGSNIDDPRANHNPMAAIFVTAMTPTEHPLGVKYNRLTSRWNIVATDGALLDPYNHYIVQIFGASAYRDDRCCVDGESDPIRTNRFSRSVGVDVYGRGSQRTSGSQRHFDFPWLAGADPLDAAPLVTPNLTPTGLAGHFVNMGYSGIVYENGNWSVAREDGAPMAESAAFNVWLPVSLDAVPPQVGQPPVEPPLPPATPSCAGPCFWNDTHVLLAHEPDHVLESDIFVAYRELLPAGSKVRIVLNELYASSAEIELVSPKGSILPLRAGLKLHGEKYSETFPLDAMRESPYGNWRLRVRLDGVMQEGSGFLDHWIVELFP